MTYITFEPPRTPTSVEVSTEISVRINDFGDAYEQSVADGLNAVREKLTVKWSSLTSEQCRSASDFFRSQYGVPFLWTRPKASQVQLWRCISWNTSLHETVCDLSAEFAEVFA